MNDLRDAHAFLDELHFLFDLVPSDRLIAQGAREPRSGTSPGAVGLRARHCPALDALTGGLSECSFHFGHGTERVSRILVKICRADAETACTSAPQRQASVRPLAWPWQARRRSDPFPSSRGIAGD